MLLAVLLMVSTGMAVLATAGANASALQGAATAYFCFLSIFLGVLFVVLAKVQL